MNPVPFKPPHCSMCGGSNLTPATQFKQQGADLSVQAVFQGPDQSWASTGAVGIKVGRCRLCLDCGYVHLFLSGEELNQLRQRIGSLAPVIKD